MTVGKVITEASMSLDGFVALEDNTIGRLFDWLQNCDLEIPTPAKDFAVHLTPQSAEHWRRWTSQLGVLVVGRTLFDFVGGWNGRHTHGRASATSDGKQSIRTPGKVTGQGRGRSAPQRRTRCICNYPQASPETCL